MLSWADSGYLAYGIVMIFILILGFAGNILMLMALLHSDHRKKTITPFMVNLAVADLCIILFGYPIVLNAIITGEGVHEGQAQCILSGVANGVVGISSIACLTVMSLVMYQTITEASSKRLSRGRSAVLIAGSWLYGILAMLPPALGWNKFVPGAAKISCCPDWTARSAAAISYNIILVLVGFVIPLTLICVCYFKIFRFLRQDPSSDNASIQASRRTYQIKLVRMTVMAIAAFVLSWSPYCVVSLTATFKGGHVVFAGEAEMPELLAKASVVFNPLVFIAMNDRFRATLKKMLFGRLCQNPVVPTGEGHSKDGGSTSEAIDRADTTV